MPSPVTATRPVQWPPDVLESGPAESGPAESGLAGSGLAGSGSAGSGSAGLGWVGWAAILAVTAFGGLLRFWRLDRPHSLVFDETYYVKEAANYLKVGYELRWTGPGAVVDAKWAKGDTKVFLNQPDFVVHPPVGKWMIAGGEWLFGTSSPWGWRFSSALVGTLSILMLALIARRLFGSTLLGVVAGLLLAVDGEAFVESRTALLDGFVMFWALAGFGALVLDRDAGRRRLAARITALDRFGPGLGVRWWRIAAAVCFGLCTGTKWSGLYFFATFSVMALCWDVAARRAVGVRRWLLGGLLRDGVPAALVTLPVALGVYLATWTGWFRSSGAYDRQWAADHPSQHFGWVPDALRSLWQYHTQMYQFNVNLAAGHPYKANPWSWIIMGRPTAFYYQGPKLGHQGCRVAQCSQAVTALGNPVIWWGATGAIAVLLFAWALRRDWRAGAVLAGLVGGYLPWFHYQHRTIYNFYVIAFTPWVVLALTFVLGMMLGRPDAAPLRRKRGALAAGAVVLLAVLAFWFFLPIYSAEVIPLNRWSARMWAPSWI